MSLGWCDRPTSIPGMGLAGAVAGAIAVWGAPPRAGRRRDADLELAHEPQKVGPLEPERPSRPRTVAAGLGQGRLDEPPLELANCPMETLRPGLGW